MTDQNALPNCLADSLFRHSPDFVVYLDANGRVVRASKHLTAACEVREGRPFLASLDPFTVPLAERVFETLRDRSGEMDKRLIMHHRRVSADGLPVSYTWVACFDDSGTCKGFLGIGIETVGKQEQQELGRLREEMMQLRSDHDRRMRELIRLRKQMEDQTYLDSLTGLGNRRFILEQLRSELPRAVRYDHPMTIFLFDIDHMSRVNEDYGQDVGDEVLRTVAEMVRTQVRETDIVARYDGEQFLVLCPNTDRASSQFLTERLRRRIAELSFDGVRDGEVVEFGVTISLGILTVQGENTEFDVEAVLQAVHQALDSAKLGGVNRVQLIEAP